MRTNRLSLIGLMVGLAACSGVAWATNVVETTQHQAEAAPLLVVESDGGSIELQPGAAGVVKVEARRQAATKEEALALPVTVEKKGDRVVVAFHKPGHWGNQSVSFVIQAPASTKLELKTGGGSIKVNGFAAGGEVRTGGGSVALANMKGKLSVETGGGSISFDHVDGTVAAQTGGGSIHVSSARLSGENTLTTGGGSVECAIGNDARLRVEGSTGGGRARNDFGLAGDGRHFSGAIGDGKDGTLEIHSGGGSIALVKG
jgi:hypothetical protein